jgi:hypothetical protein
VLIALGIANKGVYNGSWRWIIGNNTLRKVTRQVH